MTQERADEIVRKVIYARLNAMPKMKDSEEAFHIGRMIGQMQRQLEIELSLEVEPQESEKIDCKSTKCENCINHNYCEYEPQRKRGMSNED